jgi:uncharacterized membrane protein
MSPNHRWAVGLAVLLGTASSACGPISDVTDGGSCPADQPASCVQPSPTYDGGIAALIAQRCFPCHAAADSVSGISLGTYGDIHTLGSVRVLSQVANCRMPPPDAGQLTTSERAELLHWLVCSAKEN